MRYLVYTFLLAATLFAINQTAFAVCTEDPPNTFTCDTNDPNPDPTGVQAGTAGDSVKVDMLSGSAINTILAEDGNGGEGISTDNDDDMINLTDAEVRGQGDGIDSGNGDDIINIIGSDIFGLSDGIETISGNVTLNIVDSTVSSPGDAITMSSGSSVISIKDSMIAGGSNNGIDATAGTDLVTLEDSIVSVEVGVPVGLRSGDDTLTLLNGVVLEGGSVGIDCDSGFDTIIFAMDVPEEAVEFISSQILQAGLPNGSITINGLFYDWENCELLVSELVGVRVTKPIPTLSEWGLIAMAGVLGIVGLLVMRRRVLA